METLNGYIHSIAKFAAEYVTWLLGPTPEILVLLTLGERILEY